MPMVSVDVDLDDVLFRMDEETLLDALERVRKVGPDGHLMAALVRNADHPMAGGWLERAAFHPDRFVLVEQRLLEQLYEALSHWVNAKAGIVG